MSLSLQQPGHDRPFRVSVVKLSFPQLNNFSVTLCSQTAEPSGSSANHSPHLASFGTTVGRFGFGWTSRLFEALRSGRSCVNKQCVSSNVGPRWGSDHPRWEPQRATCPAHMSVRASHCCEARAAPRVCSPHKPGMVVHACSPNIQEGARGIRSSRPFFIMFGV